MNFYKIVLHKLRESGVLNRFDCCEGLVFMRMNKIIVYILCGRVWMSGNLCVRRWGILCQDALQGSLRDLDSMHEVKFC